MKLLVTKFQMTTIIYEKVGPQTQQFSRDLNPRCAPYKALTHTDLLLLPDQPTVPVSPALQEHP